MMTPLSIYIHWPFCKSKCPYCDFNSHVRLGVEHERWRKALLREMAHFAEKLPGREVVSIFFGGGTPSLMEGETVAALIGAAGRHWRMAEEVEITLEANPTSVEAAKFRQFRAAGVNRVSLGVQALSDADLKFLGREHNAKEALQAVALARETFPRMSFDLIYARPGQTLQGWEAELTQALTLADGHLSLYQLTIEENTAFYPAYHSGKFTLPDEDTCVALFQLTQEILESHGMPAYEISNHARPGQESRHNLVYWRGEDAIGIGPGAHGRYNIYGGNASPDFASTKFPPRGRHEEFLRGAHANALKIQRVATEILKSPERWLEKVEQCGTGLVSEITLSQREWFEELVLMGLRLRDGIEYADCERRTGLPLREQLSAEAIAKLQGQALVVADDQHIRVTDTGRLLLNRVTADLLADKV